MAIYVIADLHLNKHSPTLLKAFSSFVQRLDSQDKLYIIGDLFNFFIGLDPQDQAQALVSSVLAKARKKGIITYFIHGNRDFLMSSGQAKKLNMVLVDDVSLLDHNPFFLILTHGDLFCTNDLKYMQYYQRVNNPYLQFIFRALPLFIRRKIARKIRAKSINNNRFRKDDHQYGVVVETVEKLVKKTLSKHHLPNLKVGEANFYTLVVQGHIHSFESFEQESAFYTKRFVLGAWGDFYSFFKFDVDSGLYEFKELPITDLIE